MDKKYTIKTYNQIAKIGLDRFAPSYTILDAAENPDAIMLRSYDLNKEPVADSVLAVGRAGAGVNNIPVEELSRRGIAVFNAPGANANAVKELVIAGMLIASRNVAEAIAYTAGLSTKNMKDTVEAGKKRFAGSELSGKTLGVIGLGAIGYRVANAGIDLGMKVLGYDPAMTVQNAWQLRSGVTQIDQLDTLLEGGDFVTIHVPLLDATRGMLSQDRLALMKPGAVLLNFSRDELADEAAVVAALETGKLAKYITDFPNPVTHGKAGVIALPHLGASTEEAEDNCAVMVADQLQDYLENGNVKYSVNLPETVLPKNGGIRLCLIHANEPGVMAQITDILRDEKINIADLLNKSRGSLAYTLVDIEAKKVSEIATSKLYAIPELLRLRVIVS